MRLKTEVPSPYDLVVGGTLNPSSLTHSLVLCQNIFVCAYFKERAFHADREMMRVVTPPVSPNLPEETGLKGRCEGREGVLMK